jgi:quercetin dioxygenase-like cupin family protein
VEADCVIKHHFSDNLYAKECVFPKGAQLVQHKHNYNHLSILAKGKVIVVVGDKEEIIEAPACINITADKHHGVLALEECVWFCIHATDETDISKIDEVLIKE